MFIKELDNLQITIASILFSQCLIIEMSVVACVNNKIQGIEIRGKIID